MSFFNLQSNALENKIEDRINNVCSKKIQSEGKKCDSCSSSPVAGTLSSVPRENFRLIFCSFPLVSGDL